jgi:hypothetical protein
MALTFSMRRSVLTMRSPISTRRDVLHAEHVKSRGRVSAHTTPVWPHGM